jgi:hypothetical protein
MSPSKKYGVIAEFSPELRDQMWAELETKAGGVCQLCEDPIDIESDDLIVEHKDNNGPTNITNLYLAHRKCNSSKRDLPYDQAKLMIRFKKFCDSKDNAIAFDDILEKYVPDNKKPIKIVFDGDYANITFSAERQVRANVMVDPTTQKKYCFAEIPINFISNDNEVQPRKIVSDHVLLMLVDFTKHPVHEPSSCRINLDANNVGKLLQFDGQHKTTAQILLNRKAVPMKIYFSPDVAEVRQLVLSIQNRIKKMPLGPAIHLTKLSAVFQEKLESLGQTSENNFVNSVLTRERMKAKQELFASLYENIKDNTNNKLKQYIQPEGTRSGKYPLSMNLVVNKILKNLVCQQLQTVDMGGPEDCRKHEKENVTYILNVIAEELLENGKWPLDDGNAEPTIEYLKAKRIFKSGAVQYWVTILRKAITNRLNLLETEDEIKFLCRVLTPEQKTLVKNVVMRLINHPIWTADDGSIDSKLNENKKETAQKLFAQFSPALNVAYLLGA